MAKYDPLREYLSQRPDTAADVLMTFAEIEALVGPLPDSARTHRAWWANDSKVEALAWRAAGWHVSSVNQLRERVVFARGTRGGIYQARRANTAPHRDSAPQRPTQSLTMHPADTDMTEQAVQSLLVTNLAGQGWQINRVADTATKEHGIDVLAVRDGRTLAVEVKGYPGKGYADPRRAGETKPTAPAVQARHWYAQAILKAMLTHSDHPDFDIAIALPDVPTYRALGARTKSSLDRLDIPLLFVTMDGQIHH